jgi:hypothetical protein
MATKNTVLVWRPIKTAPRAERQILLYWPPTGDVQECFLVGPHGEWGYVKYDGRDPTHWAELTRPNYGGWRF